MSVPLLTDQHVTTAIVHGLRLRSVDVLTAFEDGSDQLADELLLARATQLGRVLFTQDRDFLALTGRWLQAGRDFAGLVYAHQLAISIGEAIRDLELITKAFDPDDIRNHIEFIPQLLTERRGRIPTSYPSKYMEDPVKPREALWWVQHYSQGRITANELLHGLIDAATIQRPEEIADVVPADVLRQIRDLSETPPRSQEEMRIMSISTYDRGHNREKEEPQERQRWFDGIWGWHSYFKNSRSDE